jgi:SHS2 domain-containing protein
MERYDFLDHPADIAVEVNADSIEKLFEISAEAWKASAIENSSSESPFEFQFGLESISLEELLVEFLSELNYKLYGERLVYSKIKSLTIEEDSIFRIKAELYFEDFNPLLHQIKNEIKAITFHQMNIQKKDNSYSTKIVFDI